MNDWEIGELTFEQRRAILREAQDGLRIPRNERELIGAEAAGAALDAAIEAAFAKRHPKAGAP